MEGVASRGRGSGGEGRVQGRDGMEEHWRVGEGGGNGGKDGM